MRCAQERGIEYQIEAPDASKIAPSDSKYRYYVVLNASRIPANVVDALESHVLLG